MRPLIVTLLLDPASQARFDDLRAAHFPPARNHLAAHVTLFHTLPGESEPQVRSDLSELACRTPFPVAVTGLRPLGGGVAYDLASAELAGLHRELAVRWRDDLTPQDRQPLRPHVTVQNKATREVARALLDDLQADFAPYHVLAEGLALWRYLGGPWEAVGVERFSAQD